MGVFSRYGYTEIRTFRDPCHKESRDIVSTAASTVIGATTEQRESAQLASKISEWLGSGSMDEELASDMGDEERSKNSEEGVVLGGNSVSKTPDVPRLVVPGLLGSVLEKIGLNKTSPQKSSESIGPGHLRAVLEKIGKGETAQCTA